MQTVATTKCVRGFNVVDHGADIRTGLEMLERFFPKFREVDPATRMALVTVIDDLCRDAYQNGRRAA